MIVSSNDSNQQTSLHTISNSTLLDLLHLAGNSNKDALVAPNKPSLTYSQMHDNILQLTTTLSNFGIGRGDRVAIVMGNGQEVIITFLAVAMGSTAVLLNPKYKKEEFAFYYEDTKPRALITLAGSTSFAYEATTPDMVIIEARTQENGTLSFELIKGNPVPRPVELATPEDVAMILHTSGTTSRPKRVPILHANLVASAKNIKSTYQLTPRDTSLCIMPLFHVHGLVASALSTLASGGTLICPSGFHASEFWELVKTYKPTWYSAVPTMHQIILTRIEQNQEIVKNHRFRFIRSCSSSLPPVVLERMEEAYDTPVLEAYGMTEAAHQMASTPLPPKGRKKGSVGLGHGVEIGIMDENGNLLENGIAGEVVVKGSNIFQGYENNPEANAAAFINGWFRTGDQGKKDEEGYLYLTGRLKELINRGGEKISPLEIDDVLLRHPAISEAIAFAAPHTMYGEDVHAAIVVKHPVEEQELRDHCLGFLADFKIPAKFHIVEQLPRGATNKIQRLKMAQLLGIS